MKASIVIALLFIVTLVSAPTVSAQTCDGSNALGFFRVQFSNNPEALFGFVAHVATFHGVLCADGIADGKGRMSFFLEGPIQSDVFIPAGTTLEFIANTVAWFNSDGSVFTVTNLTPISSFEHFLVSTYGESALAGWTFNLRIPIGKNAQLDFNGDGVTDVTVDVRFE